MGPHITLGMLPSQALAWGQPGCLPGHDRHLLLQSLHQMIQTRLDLLTEVQHMPHIALMGPLWRYGAHGRPNGSPAITDRALPVDALLLQLPQQQDPTLSIHGDPTVAGPD